MLCRTAGHWSIGGFIPIATGVVKQNKKICLPGTKVQILLLCRTAGHGPLVRFYPDSYWCSKTKKTCFTSTKVHIQTTRQWSVGQEHMH